MVEAKKTTKRARFTNPLLDRWLNVERVLDSMPQHERQKHWSMGTWGEKTDCGTVACAAGHCGLDPWFRRRGFKLNFGARGDAEISDVKEFFGLEGSTRIFFNATSRPVSTVLKEVRGYVAELQRVENLTAKLDLPEIGADSPEYGGVFAGVRAGINGSPDYLLIVGPECDDQLPWAAAGEWAAKLVVGERRDFVLPDRRDALALFERVPKLFQPAWYWLSEQCAYDEHSAWMQYFSYGNQGNGLKGYDRRARAVRRSPIDPSIIQ
jgi:hypothetical protein